MFNFFFHIFQKAFIKKRGGWEKGIKYTKEWKHLQHSFFRPVATKKYLWADIKGLGPQFHFQSHFSWLLSQPAQNTLWREVRLPSKTSPNYFPVALTALLCLAPDSLPRLWVRSPRPCWALSTLPVTVWSLNLFLFPSGFISLNYIHEPVGLAWSAALGQVDCFSKPTSELAVFPVGNNFLRSVSGSSLPPSVQGYCLPQTELCTPVQPPT